MFIFLIKDCVKASMKLVIKSLIWKHCFCAYRIEKIQTYMNLPSYFAKTAWTSAYACSSNKASSRFSWMLNMLSRGNSFIS